MITFKKIKFRNFLSAGNNFTEINFQEKNTTLIIGSNGSGKSTLLDALCFVLFNKAFRKINKNQLINSTNGRDCLVEVEFQALNSNWKIVRGIKPNIFEVYKDKKLLDQLASNNDQQEWIEKNVLKLNYKSFTQIVILGSASFVPFMQLSTQNRREIIEDLLDIKIFSSMNLILKQRIKSINEKSKEYEISYKLTNEKVEMQKKFIQSIETNLKEQIENNRIKINKIDSEVKKIQDSIESKQKVLETDLFPEVDKLSNSPKKIKKLSELKIKIEEKISSEIEQKKFFETSSVCPTCTQTIDEKFRLNKIVEQDEKCNQFTEAICELKTTLAEEEKREKKFIDVSQKVSKINNEISNDNVQISQLFKQRKEIEKEIQDITNRDQDKNSQRDILDQLKDDLLKIEKNRSANNEMLSYYDFAQNLLKDNGVKAKIIKKYLPIINQQINKYLQMMDFYINFHLDEEFNETIKSPIHEDFSYSSFSEGEKMRINLAILFSWRDIARMKNSMRTNLLILDEVFDSSLDGMGIEYFSKIIRYVIKDANIFVISHKTDDMIDLFDRVIKFDKIKGFSKIVSN